MSAKLLSFCTNERRHVSVSHHRHSLCSAALGPWHIYSDGFAITCEPGTNRLFSVLIRPSSLNASCSTGVPYSFFLDRYADSYVNIMSAFVKYVKTGDESLEPALGIDGKVTIFIGTLSLLLSLSLLL